MANNARKDPTSIAPPGTNQNLNCLHKDESPTGQTEGISTGSWAFFQRMGTRKKRALRYGASRLLHTEHTDLTDEHGFRVHGSTRINGEHGFVVAQYTDSW